MRLNVYTEELITIDDNLPFAEITTAEYVSSRTGQPMTNYGLRVFMRSPPELHYIEGRDDDRSAVTFWCGSKKDNVFTFIESLKICAETYFGDQWATKVVKANADAIAAEAHRRHLDPSIVAAMSERSAANEAGDARALLFYALRSVPRRNRIIERITHLEKCNRSAPGGAAVNARNEELKYLREDLEWIDAQNWIERKGAPNV